MNKPRGAAKTSAGKAARETGVSKPRRSSGQSWIRRHQAVAVDSLARLLREPGASLLTWSVIGIALALPLCLMLFLMNLQQLNTGLDDAGDISLYMELGISDAGLQSARERIQAMKEVNGVSVITAEEALQDFQAAAGFGDVLEDLDENPLPAVLVVVPRDSAPDTVSELAARLESVEGVASVQVDLAWLQRLDGIILLAQRFTAGLALILGLGVVLAIGNTVRLAIENRRDEILVVKLVGGTDAYVSRPFLYTGIWFGVGGGVIALLLVLLAYMFLAGPLGRLVSLYGSDFVPSGLSVSAVLAVLAAAGALGLAGAWVSTLRHLRNIEPR